MSKKPVYLIVLFSAVMMVVPFRVNAIVTGRTYTLDTDFNEGILVGVEHDTFHDQLQLSNTTITLPFIWVPNNEGTVSKISTETGDELGRYRVSTGAGSSPSRTAVDLFGNCWVGLQQRGTVVKIGLYEAGQYLDRNGNGIIETSRDINGDGDITGAEILPWGQDECVLFEVVLVLGFEGTYVPGTYPGPYDTNPFGVAPRGLAVDSSNNLWAGTWSTQKYYYVDGATGMILKTVDVSPWGHYAYGATIDENGILWSSGQAFNHILRLDPSTDPPTISRINMPHYVDGLGLDYAGHLFVSGFTSGRLSRISVLTGTIDWTYVRQPGKGVACTSDNNVWVADYTWGTAIRYDNDGNALAIISVGSLPTGVAVDAAGKVWVCNYGDLSIKRIDPAMNTVDFSKQVVGSLGHDAYSDMTGVITWTEKIKNGTWTVVFDSEATETPWGKVSWNSSEPTGTSISVRVRSSNDGASWSTWDNATNGVPLTATPNGRYLQIAATLQIVTGEISPILYELTVQSLRAPTISIQSPENKTYTVNDVPLTFTIDAPTSWIGYSLDGETNITITGNATLTSLLDGVHHVVVYANDTFGNMGESDTVYFTIDTMPPSITDVIQEPPADVLPEDTVKINATVTDVVSGVEWVALNYTNGNGTWITKNMTNLEGNVWNGTIPAFDYCTYVNYTIVAEDKVGNIITTEEALGYQHQYHVVPEFPSFLVLQLFMAATLLATVAYRRKYTRQG